MLNFDPQLWPHPTSGGHEFHNFESTLNDDASTQVTADLADCFLRKYFFL